jgi:hypothetical protein
LNVEGGSILENQKLDYLKIGEVLQLLLPEYESYNADIYVYALSDLI